VADEVCASVTESPVANAIVEPSLNHDKTSGETHPVPVRVTDSPAQMLVSEILIAVVAGFAATVTVAGALTTEAQAPTVHFAS
jgi:hypothetical protein